MGFRLHVQKRHIIEYADCDFFKWKHIDINKLLIDFCGYENICLSEGDEYSNELEIEDEVFNECIEKIKETPEETLKNEYPNLFDNVDDVITKDYLVSSLEKLYNNRDKNNRYINLNWF